MPKFGTFHARIKIDTEELPEYDVQIDENEKKVSCWIPSKAGKDFSVCWTSTESTSEDFGAWVKLDGVCVGGQLGLKGSKIDVNYSSFYSSPSTRRYFSFSPITYTDDDSYLNAPIPNFGEIELDIRYIESQGERPFLQDPSESRVEKVHERSKKLGAHCVQFSTQRQVPETTFRHVTPIGNLARFVFRYRPLDLLQANGIAPRDICVRETLNDKRKSDEIEIKDDSSEEGDIDERMNKLKKELRQLEARRSKKRVKVEKRDHSLIPGPGEVIDLT